MNELELFAGAGGGILGSMLIGHRPVCAVEYDAYARSVLLARQNDGTFPPFPVWDDVRTFDGNPWRGIVDVVSGGFPCQDISVAGSGAGLDGERSGLWREMARIIGEVRPRFVFIENSPALVTRGLDRVLSDLAAMGFDARWGIVSAADTGAHHIRERIWILANAKHRGIQERRGVVDAFQESREPSRVFGNVGSCMQQQEEKILADSDSVRELQQARSQRDERHGLGIGGQDVANAMRQRQQRIISGEFSSQGWKRSQLGQIGSCGYGFGQWPIEPGMGRVVNGMANRAHRIKCIGNGQVPRVRAAAWELLYGN